MFSRRSLGEEQFASSRIIPSDNYTKCNRGFSRARRKLLCPRPCSGQLKLLIESSCWSGRAFNDCRARRRVYSFAWLVPLNLISSGLSLCLSARPLVFPATPGYLFEAVPSHENFVSQRRCKNQMSDRKDALKVKYPFPESESPMAPSGRIEYAMRVRKDGRGRGRSRPPAGEADSWGFNTPSAQGCSYEF